MSATLECVSITVLGAGGARIILRAPGSVSRLPRVMHFLQKCCDLQTCSSELPQSNFDNFGTPSYPVPSQCELIHLTNPWRCPSPPPVNNSFPPSLSFFLFRPFHSLFIPFSPRFFQNSTSLFLFTNPYYLPVSLSFPSPFPSHFLLILDPKGALLQLVDQRSTFQRKEEAHRRRGKIRFIWDGEYSEKL